MIEKTLRRLCDSPRRWPIVIFVTFVLGCAILLPLVDVYIGNAGELNRAALELFDAQRIAQELKSFSTRVEQQLVKVKEQEARTFSEERAPAVRKRLQSLARDSGCTVRRLNIGKPVTRKWAAVESLLTQQPENSPNGQPSGLELRHWPVSITLHGPMASLQRLLEHFQQDNMLVFTKRMDVYPEGRDRREVMLEMELWYFALARKT